ncbi:hypothetical protein FXO38_34622 [Capsicum annuum]|nr:hypothetical protein FXO38_34622 [Capsicum annuum]KAF3616801.1 hypothetical protein FXO37_34946 [Capsicum annuum]
MGFATPSSGYCSTMIELKVLCFGLQLALDHKLYPLDIETNSLEVLELLSFPSPPYDKIVALCRLMLRSLESPAVQHNFREANDAADILADFGSSTTSPTSSSVLLSPLDIVAAQLKCDREGVPTTRIISKASHNKLVSVGNQSVLSSVMSSMYVGPLSNVILHSSSNPTLVSNSSSTMLAPKNRRRHTAACNSTTLKYYIYNISFSTQKKNANGCF